VWAEECLGRAEVLQFAPNVGQLFQIRVEVEGRLERVEVPQLTHYYLYSSPISSVLNLKAEKQTTELPYH
jgi:hypothetical protein